MTIQELFILPQDNPKEEAKEPTFCGDSTLPLRRLPPVSNNTHTHLRFYARGVITERVLQSFTIKQGRGKKKKKTLYETEHFSDRCGCGTLKNRTTLSQCDQCHHIRPALWEGSLRVGGMAFGCSYAHSIIYLFPRMNPPLSSP